MKTLVLNSRPRNQATELSNLIRRAGAEVLEFPVYEIKLLENWEHVRHELATYRPGDWFVFTSVNGVWGFMNYLDTQGPKYPIACEVVHTAVVGRKTAEAARRYGFRPSVVPEVATGEQLTFEFIKALEARKMSPQKVFLWRTDGAAPIVKEELERHGHNVADVDVYRSVCAHYDRCGVNTCLRPILEDRSRKTVLTFTSGRGVEFFMKIVSQHAPDLLPKLKEQQLAVLGKSTHARAVEMGFQSVVRAPENSIEELAECALA